MTENRKRFELLSWDFTKMCGIVYDRQKKKNYNLSIPSLVELLNDIAEQEYSLGTAHAEEINKIEDEFCDEILKLEEENKQLKQQLKNVNFCITIDDKIYPVNGYIEVQHEEEE